MSATLDPVRPQRPRSAGRLASRALWLTAALLVVALAGCRGGDEQVAEGTAAAPVALTYPVTARTSQVGPSSSSYYNVSGSFAMSVTYTTSLTNLIDDADLFVYSDSGFTTSLCFSAQPGTAAESCPATPTSALTNLYILVKSASTKGTTFTMTVQ